ncbi:ABC transporter substrate-binding protein [Rhizobium mongolense]|uniref:Multiple sugar transport system substrate-binding protein n=1 Tax=Rhizobium mongolense TaxID=57676 RepID=A0A7W6RSB8_9HYPH|nr:sugar ABC transporter substrate-binding protein [Rhizobium mongolense]MBB4277721.1 multiple sugar transport system substrate-binding protein [Rhizobium mongolense]
MRSIISRRQLLKTSGIAATAAATSGLFDRYARAQEVGLSVFGPLPPDPVAPGVEGAEFAMEAFSAWKKANGAHVRYDLVPWGDLHDKMATAFASGEHVWDITYNCGWVPEFENFLVPFVSDLPQELIADLPPSSFATVTTNRKRMGVVFTLSLLTLFYNKELFAKAGISEAPKNWQELIATAKECTRDDQYGWVLNYGDAAGIGGAASYWMVFLQQAGGKLYGEDGAPAFNNEAGIDALQVMIDLMPYTDPGSLSYSGANTATAVFYSGRAAMHMGWPGTWKAANDPTSSNILGKIGCALLPAGPAGTASIDGTDAWTITKTCKNPNLARKLIEFYLDKDVQKRQALDSGWLPIRLSVLGDAEVQAAFPNAATLLEQAHHPYDSFVTADYNEVTTAIGNEVVKALSGQSTAKDAIAEAERLVAAIVKKR